MTIFRTPEPKNEPVRSYAPDSKETASLKSCLEAMQKEVVDIPLIIGGEEIRTGNTVEVTPPHNHGHVVANCHHLGDETHVQQAIDAAREASPAWRSLPWEQRAAVFLKAADLLAGPWRDTLNAATMIGQGKNCFQAEIDSACELIDFWRFNARYAQEIYERAARVQRRHAGTASSSARSRASSSRSRRSTSPPSPATCRPRPR